MMRKHFTDRASATVSRISCEIPDEGITFKDFLKLIGEEGGLLTCIILVAPFLFPVSFPGSSIPFGLAILLVNIEIIYTKHPLIPKKIMEHKISQNNMLKILKGMSSILANLDRITKERLTIMIESPLMANLNSFIMILCSFLLMLPLPVPLTDFIPAYSILFLALGSIERDGYLIFAGYIMAIITVIYLLLITFLGFSGIKAILSLPF